MYEAGDLRVLDAPDPVIEQPTDAVVRILRSCVCSTDLHPYHSMTTDEGPRAMGHEFVGVVEELGSDVSGFRRGDLVVSPFFFAVLSARQLGAEGIILMGGHKDRTDIGRLFGATDVVPERGEEGIAAVRELTGGHSTRAVWRPSATCRRTRWPSASCAPAA